MQAKNYAAQILTDIAKGKIAGTILDKCSDDKQVAIRRIETIAEGLKSAIHFNLPDFGTILGNERKGETLNILDIPFDQITISFNCLSKLDILAFAYRADDNFIGVICFFKYRFGWQIIPIMRFIHKTEWRCPTDPTIFKSPSKNLFNMKDSWINKFQKKFDETTIIATEAILELLEALTCRNVEQTIIQRENKEQNDKRVRKNKLPLYEERILTIKVNAKQGIGIRTGTHESPRQHLRRGHIRRLDTGNVWVNACVVGSSEKGVIKKSYNVAA